MPRTTAIHLPEWVLGTRSDAFPSAQLLADTLAEGLGEDPKGLDASFVYQAAFRNRTMPIFDYTVKAASRRETASAIPVYARIAQSGAETVRFMNVLAGNLPAKDVFNSQNIARLLEAK
jgi:hypothetical protein